MLPGGEDADLSRWLECVGGGFLTRSVEKRDFEEQRKYECGLTDQL